MERYRVIQVSAGFKVWDSGDVQLSVAVVDEDDAYTLAAHLNTVTPSPVIDGDVTYTPWTDGYAVGFRMTRDDGTVSYIYLNPSDRDGEPDDTPAVFLYQGPHGHPAEDDAAHWYAPFDD